jgi:murein DD-endopeptidase MepM/ murein hydrolase activator NlpD
MKKTVIHLAICVLLSAKVQSQEFNSVVQPDLKKTISVRKPTSDIDTVPMVANTDTFFISRPFKNNNMIFAQLPIKRLKLTSGFGYRIHPVTGESAFHSGIDLSARSDLIFSVLHGIVTVSDFDALLGNYVIVNHGFYQTSYGHLKTRYVKTGDMVKAGSPVGFSGSTGRATGEHLHFSVKYKGLPINPLPFLREILQIEQRQHLTNLLTSNN